jgi:ferrochelatase
MSKSAVLLLNLGSPDSPSVADVKRYLREFLGDERVIDKPDNRLLRSVLVNGIIIPFRAKNSAHAYSTVWTAQGSPLVVTSRSAQTKLQARTSVPVELAMNYGSPSIPDVLRRLVTAGVDRLLLFPQYPHYAMSSWETVVVKVQREAAKLAPDMKIECVQPYYADPDYITALVSSARPYLAQPHDHLLFSYHGIPVRHLTKADMQPATRRRSPARPMNLPGRPDSIPKNGPSPSNRASPANRGFRRIPITCLRNCPNKERSASW